jgi:inhibitor of cysteine peptidase
LIEQYARMSVMATVQLTKSDDGRSVEVREGEEIVLRLPENPTTGFRWHVERADAMKLVGDSFELDPNPQIGSGGVRELRFRPTSGSPGRLILRHWQPWEGESSIIERFAVDLRPAS